MQPTQSISIAIALGIAFALTIFWGIWKWRRQRRRQSPRVVATVEAIPSLRVEGSYRAIRLLLHNMGRSRATVEEIILCRRPGWFEFGIVGPLVRLDGFAISRLNIGIASCETVRLPVTLGVNELWEMVIPLELENPDNKNADVEESQRLERFSEAVKMLKSGTMRYSIQLSCSPGEASREGRLPASSAAVSTLRGASRHLTGWVSLASYRGTDFGL